MKVYVSIAECKRRKRVNPRSSGLLKYRMAKGKEFVVCIVLQSYAQEKAYSLMTVEYIL